MNAQHIRTSAPGKLMLFGEYAVLDGAPAILSAVDRRVVVEGHRDVEVGGERYQLDDEEPLALSLEALGGGTHDVEDESACANTLVDAVLHTVAAADELAGWRWRADTSATKSGDSSAGAKLGVGSSAASCVALAAAFVATRSDTDTTGLDAAALLRDAFDAHRRFQSGRGSGADVGTAALGGTVVYRLVDDRPHAARLGDVPLYWRAVWTCESANTREFIAAIEALRERDERAWSEVMSEMRRVAVVAADAVARGDADTLFEQVGLADASARTLGTLADVPIVTDAHAALATAASSAGLVAKISGAGGGDLSLVFGHNPREVDTFVSQLDHPSLTAVDLRPDASGVRVSISRDTP